MPGVQWCRADGELTFAISDSGTSLNVTRDAAPPLAHSVDFSQRISFLVPNATGQLIAIVRAHAVTVVAVTGGVLLDQSSVEIRLDPDSEPIVDAVWSPIARYHATLVLLNRSEVYTFDIANPLLLDTHTQLARPSQSIALPWNTRHSTTRTGPGLTIGADDDNDVFPVAMAFGTAAESSGSATLFVATSECDIYAIFPLLPDEYLVPLASVPDDAQPGIITELQVLPDGSSIPCLVRKRHPDVAPAVLGPLSFAPFPRILYEHDLSSLCSVDVGAFNVLAVAFGSSKIGLFLQDGAFAHSRLAANTSAVSFACVAVVSVPDDSQYECTLSTNFFAPFAVFIAKGDKLFVLDLSPWALPLAAAVQENDHEKAKMHMESARQSRPRLLLSQCRGFSFTGKNGDLAYHDGTQTRVVPNPLVTNPKADNKKTTAAPAVPELDKSQARAYQATGMDKVRLLLAECDGNVPPRPPPVASIKMRDPIFFDLKSLVYFSAIANTATQNAISLTNAGLLMREKAKDQRLTIDEQVKDLGQVEPRTACIRDKHAKLKDHLERVIEQNRKLKDRISAVSKRVDKPIALPLCREEIEFAKEVSRCNALLDKSGSLQEKYSVKSREADIVLAYLKMTPSAKEASLPTVGFAGLTEALAKNDLLLSRMKQQLQIYGVDRQLKEKAIN